MTAMGVGHLWTAKEVDHEGHLSKAILMRDEDLHRAQASTGIKTTVMALPCPQKDSDRPDGV